VVPAARSYDSVTVFARTLAEGRRALAVVTGPDEADPRGRGWPDATRLAAPARPRVAVPREEDLRPLSAGYLAAFHAAVAGLDAAGADITVVDTWIDGLTQS